MVLLANKETFFYVFLQEPHGFKGAYQVIHQQFLQHLQKKVSLVNMEEDIGLPALQKAKESYYPIRKIPIYSFVY